MAGVDASTIGMVEAHGPGTPVGDPIEYASLAEVYGIDGPCALASVKTNFGHTQSAAGALGLMKAVLALQHGVVPRNLHFTRLPDEMAQIETNLFVPQANTPWPRNGHQTPRRAAVSSYGFSGTNIHAIVEQAPETAAPDDAPTTSAIEGSLLFPLSATSADALRQTAGRLADWVDARAPDLGIGSGVRRARRRAQRPVRAGVIAGSLGEVTAVARGRHGDSPYHPRSGRTIEDRYGCFPDRVRSGRRWAPSCCDQPVFAATVAEAEPLIAREAGFSVTTAMSAPEVVTGIERVQPTLFAMQVALAAIMRSYGVCPGAVIGHSPVRLRQLSSPERCRWKTAPGLSAAARG